MWFTSLSHFLSTKVRFQRIFIHSSQRCKKPGSECRPNHYHQASPQLYSRGEVLFSGRPVAYLKCTFSNLYVNTQSKPITYFLCMSLSNSQKVINSENNHCFGCSSAAERDRWIEDLRRAAHPNKVYSST